MAGDGPQPLNRLKLGLIGSVVHERKASESVKLAIYN